MNASYRLNKLLSNPRRQKKCGWLDKIAEKTDFTKSAFLTSWKFYVVFIGGVLGALEIASQFNATDTVFNLLISALGVMAVGCFLQMVHIERVRVLSDGHRQILAEKLSVLKQIGASDDQNFVLSISQMLKRDQFEKYHAFWWHSVGLALTARLEELNRVCSITVEVDVDTQLDCLYNPPPNKKLKV